MWRRLFPGPPDEFVRDSRVLGGDVDWAAFPWPEPGDGNRRHILGALRAVVEPHPKDWTDAGTLVRSAVGNDHRGTIYPAAVAMTEQLLIVARDYPGDPRCVALGVLDQWWSGFQPERGLERYTDANGARVAVIHEIARLLSEATHLLTRIAADPTDPSGAALARNLLTVIPLGWGHTVEEHGVVQAWDGVVDRDGIVHFP